MEGCTKEVVKAKGKLFRGILVGEALSISKKSGGRFGVWNCSGGGNRTGPVPDISRIMDKLVLSGSSITLNGITVTGYRGSGRNEVTIRGRNINMEGQVQGPKFTQ